ncbi:TraB/GumN family protein [Altericroceibacterium xinjiangense]|uniref:TraB/GumN family protein n=1 Tax=Altericroceibacterium xinjiangense TaxID=762261 RepID=UPI0013DF3870|nr:TraB/GumN family protein [Altericroceibacterium xinjiangense]
MPFLARLLFRPLAALSLLGLPGCATFVDSATTAEAQQYPPGPALWAVSDADTTIYLFGTVHSLPSDVDWFKGPVQHAFAVSDELVTEVSVGDTGAMQQELLARAQLPKGQSLRGLMSKADRILFEETLVSLGLPVEALDRFKPWYAAMMLSVLPLAKAGFGAESGVEMVLSRDAPGKKMSALETVEQQIELFDGLPMAAQVSFLNQTVTSLNMVGETVAEMVARWLEGDANALARLLNAEIDDPVLRDRLLTRRNANWAEWIDRRLQQPGTVFVAVGAGHLAGKGSVQDQLKARGITTARVVEQPVAE